MNNLVGLDLFMEQEVKSFSIVLRNYSLAPSEQMIGNY